MRYLKPEWNLTVEVYYQGGVLDLPLPYLDQFFSSQGFTVDGEAELPQVDQVFICEYEIESSLESSYLKDLCWQSFNYVNQISMKLQENKPENTRIPLTLKYSVISPRTNVYEVGIYVTESNIAVQEPKPVEVFDMTSIPVAPEGTVTLD